MSTTRAAKLAPVILLCLPAVIGPLALWALGADVLPDRAASWVGSLSVELVGAAWTAVSAGLLAAAPSTHFEAFVAVMRLLAKTTCPAGAGPSARSARA